MTSPDLHQEKTSSERGSKTYRPVAPFISENMQADITTTHTILDALAEGAVIIDQSGNILLVNTAAEAMFGYQREELVGKSHDLLIPEGFRKIHKAHEEHYFAAPGNRQMGQHPALVGHRRDGTEFPLEIRLTFIDTMKGALALALINDLTLRGFSEATRTTNERKLWEKEVLDARNYAENIVETVRGPLVVLTSTLKILTANHSFYDTFKVTPEETIGNYLHNLGNGQWDIPKLRILLEEILPHETVLNDYEVEHDFLDIGHKTMLLNAREIFREDIGSHIILLAMEDITDRRRAEDALLEKQQELEELNGYLEERIKSAVAELRQKDHMMILEYRQAVLGQLINSIAHHWRQPLNTLGLVIQQVPLFSESGEPKIEFLNENAAKGMELIRKMSRTIDDFRSFFRSDDEMAAFSVQQVIERTLSLVEETFKEKNIDISLHVDGDPMGYGYPNEYSQALLCILMNARDVLIDRSVINAMISVHLFGEGDKAVVTITDNAGGIADEILMRLFDPYFTTKGPDKGVGIGLFMSRTIIEKNMGGSLKVRNTGSGAEFRIEVAQEAR